MVKEVSPRYRKTVQAAPAVVGGHRWGRFVPEQGSGSAPVAVQGEDAEQEGRGHTADRRPDGEMPGGVKYRGAACAEYAGVTSSSCPSAARRNFGDQYVRQDASADGAHSAESNGGRNVAAVVHRLDAAGHRGNGDGYGITDIKGLSLQYFSITGGTVPPEDKQGNTTGCNEEPQIVKGHGRHAENEVAQEPAPRATASLSRRTPKMPRSQRTAWKAPQNAKAMTPNSSTQYRRFCRVSACIDAFSSP